MPVRGSGTFVAERGVVVSAKVDLSLVRVWPLFDCVLLVGLVLETP